MRSIETNTKFEVDINDKFQINQTKMTNESKFGEKLSAKYSLNCSDGGNQVCAKPIDVTLCTEICGIDMEFGKIVSKELEGKKIFSVDDASSIEGIAFKFNIMGANVSLASGKLDATDAVPTDNLGELFGDKSIIALEICGNYCGYDYQIQHQNNNGSPNLTKAYVSLEQAGYRVTLGSEDLSNNSTKWRAIVGTNMGGYDVVVGYNKGAGEEQRFTGLVEHQLDDHSKACLLYNGDEASIKLTYGQ